MKGILPAVALVLAGGCATSPPARSSAPLAPPPRTVEAPDRIAALVARLGDEDFARREAAGAELRKLGMEPGEQAAVVKALRAAATLPDPEVRGRAQTILGGIDRSESMIEAGRVSYAIGADRVGFAFRHGADGSVELSVGLNRQPEELFSAKDMASLAAQVNEAARNRGYAPEDFAMLPDGTMNVAGNSMRLDSKAEEHLVRSWELWVARVEAADRSRPEARGTWRVDARTLDGRAFRAGLRIGDCISEVDGARPASLAELDRALQGARAIKVLRWLPSEVELRP